MTTTSTLAPAEPAGETQVIVVSFTTTMLVAATPDSSEPWGLAELQAAVTSLQRQAEIDKSKLPRWDSDVVQKMLSPATIRAAVSDEGGVRQVTGTLTAARVNYVNAFTVYRLAGAKEYAAEAISMLRMVHALYWEDLRRFDEWRRTAGSREEDTVSKQLDGHGLAFCRMLLTDTNMVRAHFPGQYQAEFEAFAVKHFPLAFDMLGKKHRSYAAEFLFRNKTNVDESLSRGPDVGLARRKQMLQRIEAAIKADIPANTPGSGR